MKRLMVLVLVGFLSPGCALFMSEGQYNTGVSLTPAGSQEWARIQQDKLALEKVQALPAYTANVDFYREEGRHTLSETALNPPTMGYKGYVKNESRWRTYNIIVSGPERKSWLVPPGVQVEDYLIPGQYVATTYYGNSALGKPWCFRVTSQLNYFQGKRDAHWYLLAQW